MPSRDPKGRFSGALNGEILKGKWTDDQGVKTLSVTLELEDILTGDVQLTNRYASTDAASDAELEQNAQSFYLAVLRNEKDRASEVVHYPLSIDIQGRRKTIHNKSEFVRNYESIFTNLYKKCIQAGIPHNVFSRNGAVMQGRGEVWFDGRGYVIGLNPCVPR